MSLPLALDPQATLVEIELRGDGRCCLPLAGLHDLLLLRFLRTFRQPLAPPSGVAALPTGLRPGSGGSLLALRNVLEPHDHEHEGGVSPSVKVPITCMRLRSAYVVFRDIDGPLQAHIASLRLIPIAQS